jgi:hypothetical protein
MTKDLDSEETIAANLKLRIVLKTCLFIDTKAAANLQEAIDELIFHRMADAVNALSDRLEEATGVRP